MSSRREKVTPNYSAQDVPVTISQYGGGLLVAQANKLMSLQSYEGREQDMDRIKQVKVSCALGEGAMTLTSYEGSESESGTLILYSPSVWSNQTAPAGKLEITEMANSVARDSGVSMPDTLTLPSSALKPSIAKEMARTGSFIPLGEAVAPIIEKYTKSYDEVVVLGNSFGGRLAPAAVATMSNEAAAKLSEVVVFDPPSIHERLSWRIAPAQAREMGHQKRYTAQSHDPVAKEVWTGDLLEGADKTLPTPSPFVMMRDVGAMEKPGFEGDLDKAFSKIPPGTPVTLFTPELSELNDNTLKKVHNFAERVSTKHPMSDVRTAWLGDTTHSILAGNPDIFARTLTLGRDAITPFSGRK